MIRSSSLAVLLLCLAAAPAAAQTVAVKGGVNLATQTVGGGGPSLDSRIGLVAGGFIRLPLASWLALQAEGLYSEKGAKLQSFGTDLTLRLDYVEVPVLARVAFGGGHRYFAVGGPSTAFRVRAKGRTDFGGSTEEIDLSDEIERIDFGVAAGGGVEIGSLVLDARYTFGILNIDKNAGSTTKNRAISVTAGFRF